MDAAERFVSDETFQRFDSQGELTERERSFRAQSALAQPRQILFARVFGSVNDPEIFAAAALYRRLDNFAAASLKERERLHDHSFAAFFGQVFPPADRFTLACLIRKIDDSIWRRDQQSGVSR